MARELIGKRIAILATDRFEEAELSEPRRALMEAGADVDVIAPHSGTIQGMNHDEIGNKVPVDRTLDEARAEQYDALVLPGGVANPDRLRANDKAVRFIRAMYDERKPIAAICHGPWTLIEADIVRGRIVTSWPSLKTDLENAGADWVDREVMTDGGLVTSRKPDDIPAFTRRSSRRSDRACRRSSAPLLNASALSARANARVRTIAADARKFWIPAEAGIHFSGVRAADKWVPAYAGTYKTSSPMVCSSRHAFRYGPLI